MNKIKNKRKIKIAKTLEGRYIKRKYRVGRFVQVTTKRQKEERKKVEKRPKSRKRNRMLCTSSCKTPMV